MCVRVCVCVCVGGVVCVCGYSVCGGAGLKAPIVGNTMYIV